MNIGIIGFGSIGERHFHNIRKLYPKFKINILTKRKLPAYKNTGVFYYEKDFFGEPNDVFFVTNETFKHVKTVLKCLNKSPKGIFLEKPLSHNLKGITLIQNRLNKDTFLFIGYCLQFHGPFLKLKSIIKNNTIGTPLFIRASVGQDLRTWRKRSYKNIYSFDSKKGGGVVLDLIHEINYPAWLLDERIHFKSGFAKKMGIFEIKSEDIAEGIFLSDSGKLVSIHLDYLQSPGRRYCEIVGTKGTAIWDSRQGSKIQINKDSESKIVKVRKNNMYTDELKFFMEGVKSGKSQNNIKEGINDLKNALMLKKYAN